MSSIRRIALLGFLPWVDPQRGITVEANPAALAAERAARLLREWGRDAVFVPVEVSGAGIRDAMGLVARLGAEVVIAAGQSRKSCRVETVARHPGVWAPADAGEPSPWAFELDGEALAAALNAHLDPAAETGPFVTSDDAGAYYCEHLCVELVRDQRRRGTRTVFLHVASIDGLHPELAARRVRQYAWQLVEAARWCDGERPR